MANIKIVKRYEELNSLGCEFFTKVHEGHITRISSTKLRWLSIRTNNGEFISSMQKNACAFLKTIAEKYGAEDWDKLNLKILLYDNPIKSQDDHIKTLLKCGADIRYLQVQECSKIVIQDNIIYITFASSFEKVVNSGIYYVGSKNSDPLIDYQIQQFDKKFNIAKRITLNKNLKIVNAVSIIPRLKTELSAVSMRDWIIILIGALIGGIISVIITILL